MIWKIWWLAAVRIPFQLVAIAAPKIVITILIVAIFKDLRTINFAPLWNGLKIVYPLYAWGVLIIAWLQRDTVRDLMLETLRYMTEPLQFRAAYRKMFFLKRR